MHGALRFGGCRGLSSCDSKTTDSPGLAWQGLGSQCLAQAVPAGKPCLSPGQVELAAHSLSHVPGQPASLYSCFQAGPVFSAPREQTFCGDRTWAYSLGSLGWLFPLLQKGYDPLCNLNHIRAKGQACVSYAQR